MYCEIKHLSHNHKKVLASRISFPYCFFRQKCRQSVTKMAGALFSTVYLLVVTTALMHILCIIQNPAVVQHRVPADVYLPFFPFFFHVQSCLSFLSYAGMTNMYDMQDKVFAQFTTRTLLLWTCTAHHAGITVITITYTPVQKYGIFQLIFSFKLGDIDWDNIILQGVY